MSSKRRIYDPGEFEWLLTINERSSTKNGYGEEEPVLVPVTQVWAKKQYQAGREFYAGNAGVEASKVAQEVVMYTFRYLEGLHEMMMITDKEESYDITRISVLNRNQYHQVIAQRNGV
ncbi:MAG: head-tail adaptor protein [Geobacteraceae bacterium]|nr:head-tail adaptor protein [Geobacteraceae bacterium]